MANKVEVLQKRLNDLESAFQKKKGTLLTSNESKMNKLSVKEKGLRDKTAVLLNNAYMEGALQNSRLSKGHALQGILNSGLALRKALKAKNNAEIIKNKLNNSLTLKIDDLNKQREKIERDKADMLHKLMKDYNEKKAKGG